MIMQPFYLKFPNEQSAREALVTASLAFVDPESGALFVDPTCVDVIGAGFREYYAPDGKPLAEPKVHDGFEVNVLLEALPSGLAQYEIHPTTPARVFAGFAQVSPAKV